MAIASKNYLSTFKRTYDTVNFRTIRGGKDEIKRCAEHVGMTMNDFLRKMVVEGMKRFEFEFDPNLIFPSAVMPDEFKDE